jgi:hypothetical protein
MSPEAITEFGGIIPLYYTETFARELNNFGNSLCSLSVYDAIITYHAQRNATKETDQNQLALEECALIEEYHPKPLKKSEKMGQLLGKETDDEDLECKQKQGDNDLNASFQNRIRKDLYEEKNKKERKKGKGQRQHKRKYSSSSSQEGRRQKKQRKDHKNAASSEREREISEIEKELNKTRGDNEEKERNEKGIEVDNTKKIRSSQEFCGTERAYIVEVEGYKKNTVHTSKKMLFENALHSEFKERVEKQRKERDLGNKLVEKAIKSFSFRQKR